MSYVVPKQRYQTLLEIKKSKFYACAGPVESRDEAMAMLSALKVEYPDARHHCWAYLLGDPINPTTMAMSDDGEPSGTAGKPILNVLQHKNVGNIMMVVTRYFGGIKLGAGGLVRAYSGAAQQTMSTLPVLEQITLHTFSVVSSFANEQFVRHWVASVDGTVQQCDYGETVTMIVGIPPSATSALMAYAGSLHLTVKATNKAR
ncbi:YigZ family protein [Alteromonas sp. C1M14]|uniref:YigZ family protein n=1 Tax=Alteromonas sp. C1M14 TaxID=2841567 RepID=UPI001C093898|nr:YigZ family protein [Alteromonas sp. C1M14]MBU2977745.1 YigZ family protein [Alteromonas sp. C1M14]